MLDSLKTGLRGAISKIVKSYGVDERVIEGMKKDVQRALLLADVDAVLVVQSTNKMAERALNEKPPPGLSRKDHILTILYEEMAALLGEENRIMLNGNGTTKIMLLGIQGSGKTTTCAKLAKWYRDLGKSVGVVGADDYRPGALEQLRTMCDKANCRVYGDGESAIDVVRNGVEHFDGKVDIILVDTAGRHSGEGELLREMRTMSCIIQPDHAILVIDGTIGQQCGSHAAEFHRAAPVSSIIVTKLDSSAKGGGALAAVAATGAHITHVCNGETIDDMMSFSPTKFMSTLLGMGNIRATLDLARKLGEAADVERNKRIYRGSMSLTDFLREVTNLKEVGMQEAVDSMPFAKHKVSQKRLANVEERMEKWQYVIQSMTKDEIDNPHILTRSRIRRVSRGAGCTDGDVRYFLKQFNRAKKNIKAHKGHKMKDITRRLSV